MPFSFKKNQTPKNNFQQIFFLHQNRQAKDYDYSNRETVRNYHQLTKNSTALLPQPSQNFTTAASFSLLAFFDSPLLRSSKPQNPCPLDNEHCSQAITTDAHFICKIKKRRIQQF
jgi:hypothetical protein